MRPRPPENVMKTSIKLSLAALLIPFAGLVACASPADDDADESTLDDANDLDGQTGEAESADTAALKAVPCPTTPFITATSHPRSCTKTNTCGPGPKAYLF